MALASQSFDRESSVKPPEKLKAFAFWQRATAMTIRSPEAVVPRFATDYCKFDRLDGRAERLGPVEPMTGGEMCEQDAVRRIRPGDISSEA
jgi:hypothetical protein